MWNYIMFWNLIWVLNGVGLTLLIQFIMMIVKKIRHDIRTDNVNYIIRVYNETKGSDGDWSSEDIIKRAG